MLRKNASVVEIPTTPTEETTVDLTVATTNTLASLPPVTASPTTTGKSVYKAVTKLSRNGSGQVGLIQSFFDRYPEGGTAKQITEFIRPDLKTVQDPLKVVMFYLVTFKKQNKIVTL